MFRYWRLTNTVIALAALLLLPVWAAGSEGSQSKGTVEGTVTAADKPVIKAKVIAFNLDTGDAYEVASDTKGSYAFKDLSKGDYELSVYQQGYEVYSSPELKVEENTVSRHDIRLTRVAASNRR